MNPFNLQAKTEKSPKKRCIQKPSEPVTTLVHYAHVHSFQYVYARGPGMSTWEQDAAHLSNLEQLTPAFFMRWGQTVRSFGDLTHMMFADTSPRAENGDEPYGWAKLLAHIANQKKEKNPRAPWAIFTDDQEVKAIFEDEGYEVKPKKDHILLCAF